MSLFHPQPPIARRRPTRTGVASLVLALLATSPLRAVADPAIRPADDVPIRFERCAVSARSILQDPLDGTRIDVVSGVSLRFVNLRRIAATRVTVAIRYQGSTESSTSRGSFAPDVPIDRNDELFAGDSYGKSDADCRVTSILYVDGSTWSAHP